MIILVLLLSFLLKSLLFYVNFNLNFNSALKTIISCIVSIAVLVLIYTVHLFFGYDFTMFFQILILLNVAYIILIWRTKRHILLIIRNVKPKFSIIYPIILIASYFFLKASQPWGKWDAWAIWNLHAKFLFFENEWTNFLTNSISWTHPDYPLMLPSIIAIIWKSIGEFNYLVPAIIAYMIYIGLIITIYASISNKNLKIFGLFATLPLLFDFTYVSQSASQYADTLLSFVILISMIFLVNIKKKSKIYFLVFGFVASISMWIKNEGIAFFFLISLILVILLFHRAKYKLLYYFLGALPFIAVVVYFKLVLAPSNDLVEESSGIINKVLSIERYLIIGKYLAKTLLYDYPLILLLIILNVFFWRTIELKPIGLVLISLFLCYLCIYLITPKELYWHLKYSMYRLIQQLYPSFIYATFINLQQWYMKASVKQHIQ